MVEINLTKEQRPSETTTMSPQTPSYRTSSIEPDRSSSRRGRAEVASCLHDFDEARRGGSSQRAVAEEAGVPRGTLRYWNNRRRDLDLPQPVGAFLETPAGLAWLHRLVTAAVFVMTLRGPEGIRQVCEFLASMRSVGSVT